MCFGTDIPEAPPIPPPAQEPTVDAAGLVRQRAASERRRRDRDSLVVDPAINTADPNQTGIRIPN